MKEMGKMLLNDEVWATYDVIIGTHSSTGGDYPLPVGSLSLSSRNADQSHPGRLVRAMGTNSENFCNGLL